MKLNEEQQKELDRLMNEKFKLDELVPDDQIDYSDLPQLSQEELDEFIPYRKALGIVLSDSNFEYIFAQPYLGRILLNRIILDYRQNLENPKLSINLSPENEEFLKSFDTLVGTFINQILDNYRLMYETVRKRALQSLKTSDSRINELI